MSGGGAERVASELLRHLPRHFDKFLIIFEKSVVYDVAEDVTVIDLNTPSSNNLGRKVVNLLRRVSKLRAIKRRNGLDIVCSFLEGANIVNVLSRVSPVRTIISVRNTLSKRKGLHFGILNFLGKLLFSKADKIVAVSEGVKRDLVENFRTNAEQIVVIHNPCNIQSVQSLATEPVVETIDFHKPTVVTVGSLTAQKGQWHLIRAFGAVKTEIPNAILLILGVGELEGYLRKLALASSYPSDIRFLGFHENPFKFVAKADVFILSSLWEGFPNALVEAMACGTPVIATDCESGPREILAPDALSEPRAQDIEHVKYGILVPQLSGRRYTSNLPLTRAEQLLAKAVLEIIRDSEMRKKYSLLGMRRAEDFEVNKIVQRYAELFKKTCTSWNSEPL